MMGRTSLKRLGVALCVGVVTSLLVLTIAQDIAARNQQAEFDDERISLALNPTAASGYFDPTATKPSNNRPDLRDGMTPPTTNLREGLTASIGQVGKSR